MVSASLLEAMSNSEICRVLRNDENEVVRMLVGRLEEVMVHGTNHNGFGVSDMGGELRKRNYNR